MINYSHKQFRPNIIPLHIIVKQAFNDFVEALHKIEVVLPSFTAILGILIRHSAWKSTKHQGRFFEEKGFDFICKSLFFSINY